MNKQVRNVCWTLFREYDEDTEQEILDLWVDYSQTTYVIFQWERCPKTEKTHIQGYTEFTKGVRLSTLQRRFPGIHLEQRRGTAQQAADYCQKEDTRLPGTSPSEEGEISKGQGYRSDLAGAAAAISEGKSLKRIAQDDPVLFVKYHRGFTALQTILRIKKRNWKPTVKILWGPSGTGKTRFVYDNHDFDDIYIVPTPKGNGEVWFDGYCGQEVILFDDFYGWMKWSFLLLTIDRYPQELPLKGIPPHLRVTLDFFTLQYPKAPQALPGASADSFLKFL